MRVRVPLHGRNVAGWVIEIGEPSAGLAVTKIRSVIKVLKEGWLGMGSYVDAFEKKIHNIIQNKNKAVVAVNTGFSAIHLALILLNLKKGDEVIIPSHNNIADFQCLI